MSNKSITHAISSLIAISLSSPANTTNSSDPNAMMTAPIKGMERCYSIAKTGQNDCATLKHQCAGESTMDGDKTEWILVPDGLCKKIVNGKLSST